MVVYQMSQVLIDEASRSLADLIGQTPLLRLRQFERDLGGVELYAKAEWLNPGGSVKDRPAARIVAEGESSGQLTHDRVLLDATSGNTGIAFAMVGAARGYRVKLCVPRNVTPERIRILRSYGAELVPTDPLEGSDGAIREARRLYSESPDKYFYADQYSNEANWQAHFDTTGAEIIEQTSGRVTHFVAGLGTSGTFVGTGRRLRQFAREKGQHITLASVQPSSPLHGLEGLKHMESAIVPRIYDPSLADEDLRVDTEDAYQVVRRLASEEGILVGLSSGAALHATMQLAATLREGVFVTVFCDSGERYLTQQFWDNPLKSDGK
ncbi:MAG TPA: cysteine synthase [Acidobacteria bacterium]|jgi:cysteine synthase B|nr:cysteine synthase [Acidobacteriota bacterium]